MAIYTIGASDPVSLSALAQALGYAPAAAAPVDNTDIRLFGRKPTAGSIISLSDFRGNSVATGTGVAASGGGGVGYSFPAIGSYTGSLVKGATIVEVAQSTSTCALRLYTTVVLDATYFYAIGVRSGGVYKYAMAADAGITSSGTVGAYTTTYGWSGDFGMVAGQPFTVHVFY